jgi:hypothetical protein
VGWNSLRVAEYRAPKPRSRCGAQALAYGRVLRILQRRGCHKRRWLAGIRLDTYALDAFTGAPSMSETIDPTTAALVSLARDGLAPDLQELLVRGNPSGGIRPGMLERAIKAAIRAMQPAPLPVVTPSAGWADGEKFAKE